MTVERAGGYSTKVRVRAGGFAAAKLDDLHPSHTGQLGWGEVLLK